MSFSFTKWYIDGVDDDANAMIAYWARLAMHGVELTWHAVTSYPAETPSVHAWSTRHVEPPFRDGAHLFWQAPALGITVNMHAADAPHDVALLRRADGVVHWSGQTQSALLRIQRAGEPDFQGRGYAECLSLTIAPWHLPIDTLEWGRWIADDGAHASTWFRWHGAHDLRHVVEDGRDAHGVSVDGTQICTSSSALTLSPLRTLEHRSLREILSPHTLIMPLVPDSLLSLEESKWLAHGTRTDADGSEHQGFAIYESVVFR